MCAMPCQHGSRSQHHAAAAPGRRCVDLDGDGMIRPREMWVFYEETLKRLESMSQEPVLFEDLLCQLHDMLAPAKEGIYTLRDFKRMRPQSGLLFNALFNLHKFVLFENRDPFQMRAEAVENAGLSDWDKFAKSEYLRCVSVCGWGWGWGLVRCGGL